MVTLLLFGWILRLATKFKRRRIETSSRQVLSSLQSTEPLPEVARLHPSTTIFPYGSFQNVFLLLLSLLHGTVFFALTEQVMRQVDDSDPWPFWSTTLLNYIIFFRVIQSQLAAATKYGDTWRLGTFDYVAVFLAALFEYVLFTHHSHPWSSEDFRLWMIFGFAVFGVASYGLTYLRTHADLPESVLHDERIIQTLNIGFMIGCGLTALAGLTWPSQTSSVVINVLVSIILLVNIFASMRLTLKIAKKT